MSRNEWTPLNTSNGQGSSFIAKGLQDSGANLRKIICFNCGGIGHAVQECPLARNDDVIELRKAIMLDCGSKDKAKTTDPLKVPPKKGEPHSKYFDGVLKFWCGKKGCRKWEDHKTSEHPPNITECPTANTASTPTDQDNQTNNIPTPPQETQKDGLPTSVVPSGNDSVSAYSSSMLHFT